MSLRKTGVGVAKGKRCVDPEKDTSKIDTCRNGKLCEIATK